MSNGKNVLHHEDAGRDGIGRFPDWRRRRRRKNLALK